MICFTSIGTTPAEYFFGRYDLPPDLGTWKARAAATEEGLICEERCLLPEGRANASYLVRQVRYRDPLTRAIVRVEPEERVPRRRVRRSGQGGQ